MVKKPTEEEDIFCLHCEKYVRDFDELRMHHRENHPEQIMMMKRIPKSKWK
ncbi:MAG: hypothetical protein WA667_21400 [Candidatus Nitrosopolaris sp.]